MANLTKEQRDHLSQRLASVKYPLRQYLQAKTRKPEPAKVAAARQLVKDFDNETSRLHSAAGAQADRLVQEATQVLLFGTTEQALAAVAKLEEMVK
jgi:hypothetical protein